MNKTHEWNDIMDGFRGRRLAVHTDLASGNANMVNRADLKTQEALGWLVYNRLVWFDRDEFHARSPIEARKLWMEQGPAKDVAARLFAGQSFDVNVAERPKATEGDQSPKHAHAGAPNRTQASGAAGSNPAVDSTFPAAAVVHARKPSQEELFP